MSNENQSFKSLGNNGEVTQTQGTSFFSPEGVKKCKKHNLSANDVIKVLLRERALKQVELADMVGLSRQGLNNYISGRWGVPTQIKIKIAQALQVDSSVIWDLEVKK